MLGSYKGKCTLHNSSNGLERRRSHFFLMMWGSWWICYTSECIANRGCQLERKHGSSHVRSFVVLSVNNEKWGWNNHLVWWFFIFVFRSQGHDLELMFCSPTTTKYMWLKNHEETNKDKPSEESCWGVSPQRLDDHIKWFLRDKLLTCCFLGVCHWVCGRVSIVSTWQPR